MNKDIKELNRQIDILAKYLSLAHNDISKIIKRIERIDKVVK